MKYRVSLAGVKRDEIRTIPVMYTMLTVTPTSVHFRLVQLFVNDCTIPLNDQYRA